MSTASDKGQSIAVNPYAFSFINWVRGIAALLVFYFHIDVHVFHDYPKHAIPVDSFTHYFVFGAFDLGKYAVGVFFMVSGFLIPATLNGSSATLKTYAIHRFFRLYPAYWFSILVFIIVEMLFPSHGSINLKDVLVNLTMLQKFVGVPDVVGAFWTLQIELIFYVLCGLLFLTGQLSRRKSVTIAALLLALLGGVIRYQTGKEIPVALFIALALMFLGDTLRAQVEGRDSTKSVMLMVTIVSIALLPICLLAYKDEGIRYWLSYQVAILTFVICIATRHLICRSNIGNKIGQFLADCSYSVYLLHGTIGLVTARVVYANTTNALLTTVCAFSITLILSYLTYRFIEHPGIRIGKRLSRIKSDGKRQVSLKLKMASRKSG